MTAAQRAVRTDGAWWWYDAADAPCVWRVIRWAHNVVLLEEATTREVDMVMRLLDAHDAATSLAEADPEKAAWVTPYLPVVLRLPVTVAQRTMAENLRPARDG